MKQTAEIIEEINLTPVQKFYQDASILITGSTGFLGKILLEKLLRSCPTISTVFLIIRNKKGKNLTSRLDELFDDVIFERLKNECPKVRHKVVGISGDCGLPGLGISDQDRQLLINEVTTIFHVAATVKFDEKLKLAAAINVRAPLELLRMAREMAHLKCFVHVSTAFSNCPRADEIEEKIYEPPMDGQKLLSITENMPEKLIDMITPSVLDQWPNTYTFTKAVAEHIVATEGRGLPVVIFRPSIIISTFKEPIPAWINNMYGPTGICAAAGTGVMRTLQADPDVNGNMVPVDMCANAMIVCGAEVGEQRAAAAVATATIEAAESEAEPPVYHYESSVDQPITWGRFMELNAYYGFRYPSVRAIWYYSLTLYKSKIGFMISMFLLHYLPALLVDAVLVCLGKGPMLLKVYEKIHKMSKVLSYFSTRNFRFRSNRIRQTINAMSDEDKEIFFCDLKKLDWVEFFQSYLRGIRVYLLQDSLDTMDVAISRWRKLYWAHQATKLVFGFLLLRLCYSIVLFMFNSLCS